MKYFNSALLVLSLLILAPAYGANTETYFDAATGKLVIPHLLLGDKIYYLELSLVDSANLRFQVTGSSVVDVTPAANYVAPAATAVVGVWAPANGMPIQITLNSDGSYRFTQPDNQCEGNGDLETGTYQWDPKTSVFVARILTDSNGSCGFSSSKGAYQLIVDGSSLIYRGYTEQRFQDIVLNRK